MYIDLTQAYTSSMPVYPGDVKPRLQQVAEVSKQGYSNHVLNTSMHVGTHIDAPFHMIDQGKKIFEFPPDKFIGKGIVIDCRGLTIIGPEVLEGVGEGDIVLLYTGFGSKFLHPEYYQDYPEVSESFAKRAVEIGIKMLGMDTPSPDREPYLSHKIMLAKEILIIENLVNLESVLNKSFEVLAFPLKIESDASPARVIAKLG